MTMQTRDSHLGLRCLASAAFGLALLFTGHAAAAAGIVAVGAAAGNPPRVQVFDATTRERRFDFLAFAPGFRGGVNVAVGDVNGDGFPDVVTAAGAGGAPRVKVFDGRSGLPITGPVGDFPAFSRAFDGGVHVATGDVNGDGKADIIAGAGPGGLPRVKVFSGADGSALANFLAFDSSFRGGVLVAAADFRHRLRADLITATGPGWIAAPRIKVFSGDGRTVLANRSVFKTSHHAGVSVSSADFNHDGTVDLIVASGAKGHGVVKVFDGLKRTVMADFRVGKSSYDQQVQVDAVDADDDGFDDLLVAMGTAEAPIIRVYRGADGRRLRRFRALSDSFAGTPSVSGAVAHGRGTRYGGAGPVTQEIPVLTRLSQYLPIDAAHPEGQYVSVAPEGIPGNKHVYVVAHGWAPGYRAWVNKYLDTHVLKWWETAGYNAEAYPPPSPDPGPASVWMFRAYTQDNVPISPIGGLAQQIIEADADAVVLAYSWLDDSATTAALDNSIPEQAYRSEALTNINGSRLAAALRQALGTTYAGPIHLLGHSHGSKVVTLAAVALEQWGGFQARQLTVFDSPESAPTDDLNASNFLWHYFQQLPLGKTPGSGIFLDNYFSAFGYAYATMEIAGQESLGEVVDTQLFAYPYSVSYADDPGDWHSYPPAWYAQADEQPCADGGVNGGLAWSPLLGYDPSGLASEWEQTWSLADFSKTNQACLEQPSFTLSPNVTFDDLVITDADADPARVVNSMTLGLGPGQPRRFDGSYQKDLGYSGISFDYTFSGTGSGILVIQINDYLAYYMDSQYLPNGITQHATVNIGWPTLSQSLSITLSQPPGASSDAAVTLTNFRQFDVSLLPAEGTVEAAANGAGIAPQ